MKSSAAPAWFSAATVSPPPATLVNLPARVSSAALAAAVAMPDPVFGERVCVYAELRPGAALSLDALVAHLADAGVSKEWFPERLEVVDALPRASGGKVAKQALREDIRRRLG